MNNIIKKIQYLDDIIFLKLNKYSKKKAFYFIGDLGNIYFSLFYIIILFFIKCIYINNIIILIVSLIINTILVFIIKYSVKRNRKKEKKYLFKKIDSYSFPSGHVARLSGFIFPLLFYLPLAMLFIFLSIIVSISRMISGYHYFSDCLLGFMIGIFSGAFAKYFSFLYIDLIDKIILLLC